jgi:8-oxo-dGTP diphosphatase
MNALTSAVAAVLTDDAGRVLLCQQSQGHRQWGLPGGRIRLGESPVHAVVRDVRAEIGMEIAAVDLVGLYRLTGQTCGEDVPDVVMHVFRGRFTGGEAVVNAPGRICRVSWYDLADLPTPLTATTRAALADAVAGRSGVLREVQRNPEPELADADADTDAAVSSLAPV